MGLLPAISKKIEDAITAKTKAAVGAAKASAIDLTLLFMLAAPEQNFSHVTTQFSRGNIVWIKFATIFPLNITTMTSDKPINSSKSAEMRSC